MSINLSFIRTRIILQTNPIVGFSFLIRHRFDRVMQDLVFVLVANGPYASILEWILHESSVLIVHEENSRSISSKNFSQVMKINHKFVSTRERLVHENDSVSDQELNVMYYSTIEILRPSIVVVVAVDREKSSWLIDRISHTRYWHYIDVRERNSGMYRVDDSWLN